MELSLEQKEVVEKFKNNENIFITGPGGTGKSLLIKHLVNIGLAREKKVQVTALTGCAALLLGCYAKTLHGWAGIGLAKGDTNKIIDRVIKSKQRRKNWNQVDILIIDEVSMLSQKVFEILDIIGKRIKRNKEPFGGIQIVLSGDFFQLPPIPDEDETTASFCFESEVWKEMFDNKNIVELKTVFRQNDPAFSKILNGIRGFGVYLNQTNCPKIVLETEIERFDFFCENDFLVVASVSIASVLALARNLTLASESDSTPSLPR